MKNHNFRHMTRSDLQFHIIDYSVSTVASQDSVIGYATSMTMESGTWVDHGSTGVESTSDASYNAIDPTMILVDGTYYMSFGSYWDDIQQVTFNSNATTVTGDPYQTIYQPSGIHDVEASFPFQYGSYFYMFWSEGQANDYDVSLPAEGGEYKIRVCRSTAIGGPYADQNGTSCLEGGGNTVLESHGDVYGPGGQGVLDDPTYGPILYYRYGEFFLPVTELLEREFTNISCPVNTTIGYAVGDYQWGWNAIDWIDEWPTI